MERVCDRPSISMTGIGADVHPCETFASAGTTLTLKNQILEIYHFTASTCSNCSEKCGGRRLVWKSHRGCFLRFREGEPIVAYGELTYMLRFVCRLILNFLID